MPKDEASCEQWVWQAKEALKSCTAGAVRIAIVQSVQGEVREFTAAVGFEEWRPYWKKLKINLERSGL